MATARECRDCGQVFTVSAAEWSYLLAVAARRGWKEVRLPRSCTPCRSYRRQEKFAAVDDGQDETIACIGCGQSFVWTSHASGATTEALFDAQDH